VEIIDERGEVALRLHDVARATGASTSSIYHHFVDRDGLIIAAQVERFSRGFTVLAGSIAPLLQEATNKEEFRDIIIKLHQAFYDVQWTPTRSARVNVVGSTLGRPRLAEEIARIQDDLLTRFAGALAIFQERGWMRRDVDVTSLAALTMSLGFGRVLIELGETSAPGEQWDRLALEASLFLYFGETPELPPIVQSPMIDVDSSPSF
jgi:AcrR family transcriptional regulator